MYFSSSTINYQRDTHLVSLDLVVDHSNNRQSISGERERERERDGEIERERESILR